MNTLRAQGQDQVQVQLLKSKGMPMILLPGFPRQKRSFLILHRGRPEEGEACERSSLPNLMGTKATSFPNERTSYLINSDAFERGVQGRV
jgi:hypothetical protein